MGVGLDFMTHQIRHLVEAFAAHLTLVGSLIRVSEDVVSQVSCESHILQRDAQLLEHLVSI